MTATIARGPLVALIRSAVERLNRGDLAAAAEACAAAAKLAPDDPAVLQLRATIASRRGEWAEAAASAVASLARRPDHPPTLALAAQAHLGLGLELCRFGRAGEAEAALGAALRLNGATGLPAPGWFALGLVRQDLGNEAGAEAAFAAALRTDPALAEAAVNLGIARQRQGRMADAMAAYGQAVRLRPETFGRVAQALSASRTGELALDLSALRQRLLDP